VHDWEKRDERLSKQLVNSNRGTGDWCTIGNVPVEGKGNLGGGGGGGGWGLGGGGGDQKPKRRIKQGPTRFNMDNKEFGKKGARSDLSFSGSAPLGVSPTGEYTVVIEGFERVEYAAFPKVTEGRDARETEMGGGCGS